MHSRRRDSVIGMRFSGIIISNSTPSAAYLTFPKAHCCRSGTAGFSYLDFLYDLKKLNKSPRYLLVYSGLQSTKKHTKHGMSLHICTNIHFPCSSISSLWICSSWPVSASSLRSVPHGWHWHNSNSMSVNWFYKIAHVPSAFNPHSSIGSGNVGGHSWTKHKTFNPLNQVLLTVNSHDEAKHLHVTSTN
jgi:hypothetical protein